MNLIGNALFRFELIYILLSGVSNEAYNLTVCTIAIAKL